MLNTRVIPCLLLKDNGLVKTVKFKNPTYVGDPRNAVKIFNEKEVDELVLLDITATVENREPDFKMLREIATECFMPLGYGGGIRSIDHVKKIISLGVEKIIINSYALENPHFIYEAANYCGRQSVVVSIDVKRNLFGNYEILTRGGSKKTKSDPFEFLKIATKMGAGELMINSIDRDGTMKGYDIQMIKKFSSNVNIPIIACGGAGSIDDLADAVKNGGASAAAAGSMFVFHGKHRAVLISYPTHHELALKLR